MKYPNDIVKILFGSETYYRKCPAFCKHHLLYLTAKQISQKKCLAKQCKYLCKIEHDYWKMREGTKRLKMGGVDNENTSYR